MKAVKKNSTYISFVCWNSRVSILMLTLFLFTSGGLRAQVPSYVPKAGLVGWWPFNGNANDESGNGNNAIVSGVNLTSDRFGHAASAFSYYSSNDFIEIDCSKGNFNSPVFSISFWLKIPGSASSLFGGPNVNPAIISRLPSGGPFSDPTTTNNFVFYEIGGSGHWNSCCNGAGARNLLGNTWKHFVIVVGTDSSYGYENGGAANNTVGGFFSKSKNSGKQTFNSSYPIRLGRSKHTYWKDFHGEIDDFAVWNRALTAQEVLDLFNSSCTIFDYNPFPSSISYSRADSLSLNAGAGYTRYRWSTGDTTQTLNIKYTGGYRVTVTNASGCTGTDSIFVQFPDTVGMHVSTVNGQCNKQVDVPVRATAFRHMLTMQGSVNWNAADLRLDSISGYGPASMGMDVANFGLTQAGNGRITFSWNDPSGNGLSLADSTTVFTLRFTALGTTIRSVPVTITSTPTPIEFFDAGLVRKSNVQTAGGVNITCEFTISGKVLTPLDQGVRNVTVTLTGGASPLTARTDSAGNYSFKILPGTYTLTPVKGAEQNKTNGISTLDIALIQAHILQKTPFNASYKVIAGDANNSQGVTTGDILFLRKLILGTDTTLPGNRLWALVDGSQTFANPLVPFPFSSTKTFTNQSTDVSHTFRGIKIGDVNYDRNPLLDQAPSGDTLRLFGEWIDTEDGYVTLKVKSRAVSGLLGWQSTLRWDAKQLQLYNTAGLINNLGIGERWKDEGYLTLSWNDPRAEGMSFTEGSTWMELRFRKTSALQRAGIGMTEEKLGTEAFNGNYQSMGVKMEPVELRGNAWNGMLRVYPNPATQYMNVEWKMARAGAATVRLLDAQGRVVHVQRGEYGMGVQRATIRRGSGWSVAGTWMVQVESDGAMNSIPIIIRGESPIP